MYRIVNIWLSATLALAAFFVAPAQAQVDMKVFGFPYQSTYGTPVTIVGEIDGPNGTLETGTMEFNLDPGSPSPTLLGSAAVSPLRTQDAVVSLGQNHTCFVTSTGGAQCFGSSTHAQLGNGSTHPTNATTSPVDVANNTTQVNAVSVGLEHSCVLKNNGTVQCWGANYYGQSGNTSGIDRPTPANVNGLSNIRMLDGGEGHSCALDANGAAWCWGFNVVGQLGIGSTNDSATPLNPTGLGAGVRQISAGNNHSCALMDSGSVKCWGWNHSGFVGDGTNITRLSPVDVVGITDAKAIVAGGEHSCAVTSTNVKCWGRGVSGQLGNGTSTSSFTPVTVSALGNDISTLVAGDQFVCALSNAGDVSCWGGNSQGELGNGTNTLSNVPVSVTLGGPAIAIAAGSFHACAVLETGVMKCWGNNSHGQLGDGTTTDSNVPVVVTGVTAMLRSGASIVTTAGQLSPGIKIVEGKVINAEDTVRGLSATNFQIDKAATSVVVSTTGSPSIVGESVTFTATVSSSAGTPTGDVNFFDGATVIGTGTTANGVATLSTSTLTPGDHTISAQYAGDSNFNSSTSSSINQGVNLRSTTTDVTSSLNPSTFGASVTFTATVTATGGTPSGEVFFKAGATSLGSATIDQGTASLTTSTLAVGTVTVSAAYGGDAEHDRSVDTIDQTVGKASQTVSFTSTAPTNAVFGGPTYTATASATSGLTPTLAIDGASSSVCSISSGVVSFNAVGTCRVVASQAGNGSFNAATSVTQTFSVARASVTVSLSASASRVLPNATTNLVAKVETVAPSTGRPTGAVIFRRNGVVFGAPVSVDVNGFARITSDDLPVGTHAFTASFAQTSCCLAASSSSVTVQSTFAIGNEILVNTTTANHQTNGTVASWGTGAVAVWEQRSTATEASIIAQRMTQAGVKIGGEILVAGAASGASAPQVTALDNGTFVVVWQENGLGGRDIVMRRYAGSGLPFGPEVRANINGGGDQAGPQVTAVAGGYIIAWHSTGIDGSGTAVVFQRYSNAGVAQGSQVTVNTTTLGNQAGAAVATLSTGGFIVAWQGQFGSLYRIYARRYSAAGVPETGELLVNASPNAVVVPLIAVTGLLSGTYAIAYDQPETAVTSAAKDLYVRRFAANGTQAWIARANIAITGSQLDPALAGLGTDGLVVSWTTPDASGFAIEAQVFTADGARVAPTFRVNTTTTGNQRLSDLANTGNDGYVAIWTSSGQDGSGDGIYMQRFVNP